MKIGFFGLLTIVFVILKLTEVIAWNWVWVLSPLIFCFSFFVVLAIVLYLLDKKYGL